MWTFFSIRTLTLTLMTLCSVLPKHDGRRPSHSPLIRKSTPVTQPPSEPELFCNPDWQGEPPAEPTQCQPIEPSICGDATTSYGLSPVISNAYREQLNRCTKAI